MSAVPVTIVGTITTAAPKGGGEVSGSGVEQCVISGIATITGLEVGGGPIPPQPPSGGGQPPGIWGPTDPRPTPPIANVPGLPPTTDPPKPPIQPPVDWKPIWAGPEHGWVVVGIPNVPHPAPAS